MSTSHSLCESTGLNNSISLEGSEYQYQQTIDGDGRSELGRTAELEGESSYDSRDFEAVLSSRLQQLQLFVLEEVESLKTLKAPGPQKSMRGPSIQPYNFSYGLFDVPPQPSNYLVIPSFEEVSPLPSGSPRQNTNAPRRGGSHVGLRTQEDTDDDALQSASLCSRNISSLPPKTMSVDWEKATDAGEGEGKVTAQESSKSLGVQESLPDTITTAGSTRTTKLEQVLSLMYHNEVEGKEGRYSAQTLGFHARFLNDANFQSIVIDLVLTAFVLANIVTMGLRTELWEGSVFWDITETVFISVFTLALLLRVFTQGLRDTFVTSPDRSWNWFEVLQLIVGWFEMFLSYKIIQSEAALQDASFFALLRMARMIRITRILRICRLQIFSELLVMVVGTLGGMKTLVWAAALTAVPMYALAIMFRETLGERGGPTGTENFGTFQMAFYTVFRCTVSGECSDVYGRPILKLVAQEDGWGYVVVFCIMEFFMAFGLYNVVQGIFLENVLAGAKTNELALKRDRLRNQAYFAENMAELLTVVVRHASGELPQRGEILSVSDLLIAAADLSITPEVFEEIRRSPDVITLLKELTVSDEDMAYLFETLDTEGDGHIDLHEFVEGISKLRGGPRRSDVVANNFILQKVLSEIQEQGTSTANTFAQHERLLRSLQRAIIGEEGPVSAKPVRRGRSQPRLIVQSSGTPLNPSRMEPADSVLGRSGGSCVASPSPSLSSRGKSSPTPVRRHSSPPGPIPSAVNPMTSASEK